MTRYTITCSVNDQASNAFRGRPGADGEGVAPVDRSKEETATRTTPSPSGAGMLSDSLPDPTGGVFGTDSKLDSMLQALAALHVDLTAVLFRLELRLAAELSAATELVHVHRAATLAKAAKANHAAAATTVSKSGGGKGTESRPGTAAHMAEATTPGTAAAAATSHSHADPTHAEPMCPPLVAAAESRASSEVRKHSAARALLLVEVATLRARMSQPHHSHHHEAHNGNNGSGSSSSGHGGGLAALPMLLEGVQGSSSPAPPKAPHPKSPLGAEVAILLSEAQTCCEEAGAKEMRLLSPHTQPRWGDFAGCADGVRAEDQMGCGSGPGGEITSADRAWLSSPVPPPPALIGRTDGSITLQPRQWFAAPPIVKPSSRAHNNKSSSASTSSVAFLRLFGKAAGSGTAVALSNQELAGSAARLPYNPATGCAPSVTIRDLSPGEAYVFAVAAYSADGALVGGTIGATSPEPIEALLPLPLDVVWAYLARAALSLGCISVARSASQAVVGRLCSDKHRGWCLVEKPLPYTDAGSAGFGCGNDGSGDGDTPDSPFGRGAIVAGVHAGPLAAQVHASLLLRPSALDRAPRTTLLALAQCLLVSFETAKQATPSLLAESNPDAGSIAVATHSGDRVSKALVEAQSTLGQNPLLGVATHGGLSSAAAQQVLLVQLQRCGLCCDLAVLLQDWPLLQQACHLAYEISLRPLIGAAKRGGPTLSPHVHPPSHGSPNTGGGLWRHLLFPLTKLQQAMSVVPPPRRSQSDLHLRTLLSAALAEAAVACGETEAGKVALQLGAPLLPAPPPAPPKSSSSSRPGSSSQSEKAASKPGTATKPGTSGAAVAGGGSNDQQEGELSNQDLELLVGPEPRFGTTFAQDALFATWLVSDPLGAQKWSINDGSSGYGDGVSELRRLCGITSLIAWDVSADGPLPESSTLVPVGYAGSRAALASEADGGATGSRPGTAKKDEKPKTPASAGEEEGRAQRPPPPPPPPRALPDAWVTELVMQPAAAGDLDRAWAILQHKRLKHHPSWGLRACWLMQEALNRGGRSGGGGRIVKIWLSHAKAWTCEALEPLTLKALAFEASQDHKRLLSAAAGLQGEPATLPPYVSPRIPELPPDPPPAAEDNAAAALEGGGGEGTTGEDGSPAAPGTPVDAEARSAAPSAAPSSPNSEAGDTGAGGNIVHDGDDDDDEELASLVQEQSKGKPKDSRTRRDEFTELMTPPNPTERHQLLWLGKIEAFAGLAELDVLLHHPDGKAVRKALRELGGWCADGPWTDLRLFLDRVSLEPPLPVPLQAASRPGTPANLMNQKGAGSDEGEDEAAAVAAANDASNEEGAGDEDGEDEPVPVPIDHVGMRRATIKYDATSGDVVGPLRDCLDSLAGSVLRHRAGCAWRSLLVGTIELWNAATAVWLSPFCFAPGALVDPASGAPSKLCQDASKAELGPWGALPAEPWDLVSHALLDLLELQGVLPEPPETDEDWESADQSHGKFGDGGSEFSDDEGGNGDGEGEGAMVATSAGDGHTGSGGGANGSVEHDSATGDGNLKVDLEWAAKFVTFSMSCMVMARQWPAVVVLGRRLCELTLNLPAAAEAAYPLLLHAQQAIVLAARVEFGRCDHLWQQHLGDVAAFREREAKKRKPPPSRLKKGPPPISEEELKLVKIGKPLQVQHSNARARLQVAEYGEQWYRNLEGMRVCEWECSNV